MSTSERAILSPNMNEGRFFISPILGCNGGCSYCYLEIKDFEHPRKNELTVADYLRIAEQTPDFVFGRTGTILSIGAWGDLFPLGDIELIKYSVQIIKDLLLWENPIQIISKNVLSIELIEEIAKEVRYPGQLLYSTTITTINEWKKIEPGTASPMERLDTCKSFNKYGIPTNVLLKPFIIRLTGEEIESIANMLKHYNVTYCTVGIMYLDEGIAQKISNNLFLRDKVIQNDFVVSNYLDCDGNTPLIATSVEDLLPYVYYLRKKGVSVFLKSSCVSSNILSRYNESDYYDKHQYCLKCGNCSEKTNHG